MVTIFISYAHTNNKPCYEGQNGWVTKLHLDLERSLGEQLGKPLKIWRDTRMDAGNLIGETLDAKVAEADILLTIISPSYLNSDWCGRELKEFCESAERRGGVNVGLKSRIIKIVKIPVDSGELDKRTPNSLEVRFFKLDQETDDILPFDPATSLGDYDQALRLLTRGIKNLIEHLNRHREANRADEASKIVYLAATTSDREADRESIESELKQHKYTVLPAEKLDGDAFQIEKKARELLSHARLSVHLIGSRFGVIPERGGKRSIVRLQHDLAMKRNSDPDFTRLVWIPGDLKVDEGETDQDAFIKYLREDRNAQRGVELLSDNLEGVKTRIHELLERPLRRFNNNEGRDRTRIYLIYDHMDRDDVKPLDDYLYNLGFEVMQPLIEGAAEQVMQLHQESLATCDALLVYYSRVNAVWAHLKRQELYKLRGLPRLKPILAGAFYISGARTAEKESFRSNEFLVIKNYNGFSPDSLTPFLDLLRQTEGGQR